MTDISVQVRPKPGREGMLSGGSTTEKLADRIDELTDAIGEVARRIHRRLDADLTAPETAQPGDGAELRWHLEDVTLGFSADLEAEAGVIIARTKASAGFEISLRWSRTAE